MRLICSSILAGLCIGIGSAAYCACGTGIIGAVLFAIGLICICVYHFHLYTGRIGYMTEWKELKQLALMLLGNLVGAILFGVIVHFASPDIAIVAEEVVLNKNNVSILAMLLRGILCGCCVYFAVDYHKKTEKPTGILFLIPIFILCRWEHCIADLAYMGMGLTIMEPLRFWAVVAGNSIGALGVHALKKRLTE